MDSTTASRREKSNKAIADEDRTHKGISAAFVTLLSGQIRPRRPGRLWPLARTRLEVARILVAEHYPFLAPWYELERQTPWFQESYYLRMFGAVALGVVAFGDAARSSASRR